MRWEVWIHNLWQSERVGTWKLSHHRCLSFDQCDSNLHRVALLLSGVWQHSHSWFAEQKLCIYSSTETNHFREILEFSLKGIFPPLIWNKHTVVLQAAFSKHCGGPVFLSWSVVLLWLWLWGKLVTLSHLLVPEQNHWTESYSTGPIWWISLSLSSPDGF